MTTHGMCVFCTFNASAPGEDLCRDCLDYLAELKARRLDSGPLCQFGTPWCTPLYQCGCCAEFASFGSVQVWDDAA